MLTKLPFIKGNSFIPYTNIKRIKDYLEILSSKNIENEMSLDELKKLITLVKFSSDYIKSDLLNDEQVKQKMNLIITNNKNLEKNYDCIDFFYKKLSLERNDFLFKSLVENTFAMTKRSDKDSLLLEFLPNVNLAFTTVDANLIYKSEKIYDILKEMTQSFASEGNYKGVDTDHIIHYLCSFKDVNVDVKNEEFFKYHSALVKNEKVWQLDKLDYFPVYDYFIFYLKNLRSNTSKLNERLSIKKKFKDFFSREMMKIISDDQVDYSSELDNNSLIINSVVFRFEHLINLIKEFKDDKLFIKLCEYSLQKKLERDLCPIDLVIELGFFCFGNNMVSKSILHFLAFNTMEHLRAGITVNNFNKKALPLFDLIVESIARIEDIPYETITRFLEVFKSSVFNNDLLISDSIEDMLHFQSLSIEAIITMKIIHKKLPPAMFDASFDNYLDKAIVLNKSLNIIKI
jgi:hypothetical protein